jgi:vacuolar protein sorting-associated protein 45
MDVWESVRHYVYTKAIDEVHGVKSLILDEETSRTVSLVCSHTQILNAQVYSVERLDSMSKKRMGRVKAVCIIRPTTINIRRLAQEFSSPKYEEYHIFFTNTIADHLLKDLAQADVSQVIQRRLYSFIFSSISIQYQAGGLIMWNTSR